MSQSEGVDRAAVGDERPGRAARGDQRAHAGGLGARVYLRWSLDGLRAAGRVFGGWRVPGVRSQRPVGSLPRRQWRSAATRPWEYPGNGLRGGRRPRGRRVFRTVLATLLFGTFAVAAFGYYAFKVQKSDDDDWDTALFLVCLAFVACFFWCQQVLKYVIVCATASTANSWWFGKDVAPLSAFSRAVTYHYGAIWLGALVVAPIETIATSINSMKRMSARAESGAVNSVLSGCLCCVTTVLQCCESILDYFNKFAFCLVGMRGASYAYASRQVVALFGTQGASRPAQISMRRPS